jgi:hypothetical protein
MPVRCRVCTSPHRDAIEEALANGEAQSQVAKRYGVGESNISRHLNRKHPARESLAAIGDEPVLPSYDWVRRQAEARGAVNADLLALSDQHDPFYCGSEADLRDAHWFAEVWERFGAGAIHLRALHYLCVTAKKPVLWPDGAEYLNTDNDWEKLNECSRHARWLGLVKAELLDDQRNAEPIYNARGPGFQFAPSVDAGEWSSWTLPRIESRLYTGEWSIPQPDISGYDPDEYLDQPNLVGVFIEKSTMDSWLRPLCEVLHVDLYVGSGVNSIVNARRFMGRAVDLNKPAHLLVISDFDPTGRLMPIAASRHVEAVRRQVGCDLWVTSDSLALTQEQVDKFRLPRKPIKKSDKGRDRFQLLYGPGAVELDALEALHSGALAEIVRDAVSAYRDDDIEGSLEEAEASADAALDGTWERRVAPIQERVVEIRGKAVAIARTFEKKLAKLNAELQAKLKPHRRRLDQLERQAREAVEEVIEEAAAELPERPRPELHAPEGPHLFDSRRTYFEQLARYHAVSPPSHKLPRPKKKQR